MKPVPPSKKGASKQPAAAVKVRRLNVKGLYILVGVLVALGLGLLPYKYFSDRAIRRGAVREAKAAAAAGNLDLAIRHLETSLAQWPDDIQTLELKAELLDSPEASPDQALLAAGVNEQLLRLDPSGPGRRQNRRNLVRLFERYSESPQARQSQDTRYTTAVEFARQLVAEDDNDAEAHRLLAVALEGQVGRGKEQLAGLDQLKRAAEEFKKSIALDPKAIESSERLAALQLGRLNDPVAAQATLDALLKVRPDSVEVRLIRGQFFSRLKRSEEAKAEFDRAIAMKPNDFATAVSASDAALQRRSFAEARGYLDALPKDVQERLRVRVLRGQIEFAERNPDEAIDQWRKGLASVGGGDLGLTWQLSYNLIQLGRLSEARPLIAQYLRLAKNDSNGLGRYLQGLFEQASGRPDRAIDELNRASNLVPDMVLPDVLLALGRCHEARGDEARAMLMYKRAVDVAPKMAGPRRAIARLIRRKDPEQALAELERAMNQSPDDVTMIYEILGIRIAQLQAKPADQRRSAEIDQLLERTEKLTPGNSTTEAYRAEYLAVTGQFDKAMVALEKATEGVDRHLPAPWLAWATALERTNRVDQALRVLERASATDAAGDHASLRVARARILARSGRGQAARDLLAKNRQAIPVSERGEMAKALGDLLRELGDRDGARVAYAEWARLSPELPQPGLNLLALAQVYGDDEAAKLGLEALRAVGGDREPYGMAAQAMELLRPERGKAGSIPADRLDRAEGLVDRLQADAPQLPVGFLLKGMVQELRGRHEDAIKSYRLAIKDEFASPAVPRLIEELLRLDRLDELKALKARFDELASSRQQPSVSSEFDRIAAAAAQKLGKREWAQRFALESVEGRPNDIQARLAQARLLADMGKTDEAEASLRKMVENQPNDPAVWLMLIAFQAGLPGGKAAATVGEARAKYKGERPELFLAQCYWMARDREAADREFKKAEEARPDDLVTLRSLAEHEEESGRSDRLEPILRKALKLDPTASWASRSLALRISSKMDSATWPEAYALVALGAPGIRESAEDRLVRATVLARCPENERRAEAVPTLVSLADDLPISNRVGLEARVRLGQSMLEFNKFYDSWRYIAPVADDATRPNPQALAIAVEALARSGQPSEARRRLDRLAEIEPKAPRTAWAAAWTLWSEGKSADAASQVEAAYRAAEATPDAEAIGMAGLDVLAKINELEAANRLARKLADRFPQSAFALARIQVARKEYDQALASCRVALEAGSAREATRSATLVALAKPGDPTVLDRVGQIGDAARAKAPTDPTIPILQATLRHLKKQYAEEISLYKVALAMKPVSGQYLNNMAWTLSEGLDQPQEALARVDEAIQREGEQPALLDTRGVIKTRLGKYDEAIADLERAAKGDPSASTYFHLARAYYKAKKTEQWQLNRDLARKAKFDREALDPTDRTDIDVVMGPP